MIDKKKIPRKLHRKTFFSACHVSIKIYKFTLGWWKLFKSGQILGFLAKIQKIKVDGLSPNFSERILVEDLSSSVRPVLPWTAFITDNHYYLDTTYILWAKTHNIFTSSHFSRILIFIPPWCNKFVALFAFIFYSEFRWTVWSTYCEARCMRRWITEA